MLGRLVERAFLAPWREMDARAQAHRAAGGAFEWRTGLVLCFTAFVLLFQFYWGDRPFFAATVGRWIVGWKYWDLAAFGWWSGAKVVGYLFVPLALLPLLKLSPSQTGLKLRGAAKHLWIYAALFGAILPILILASRTESFAATYPFYRQSARSWFDFLAWEAMYAASFLALEYFFRGWLLFALERVFGAAAIFIAMVPYCMIHFGKPAAESAGAVVAGIILGTLALYTRSIWAGVLIHVSVALSMDCLVLFRVYGVPGNGRFSG